MFCHNSIGSFGKQVKVSSGMSDGSLVEAFARLAGFVMDLEDGDIEDTTEFS